MSYSKISRKIIDDEAEEDNSLEEEMIIEDYNRDFELENERKLREVIITNRLRNTICAQCDKRLAMIGTENAPLCSDCFRRNKERKLSEAHGKNNVTSKIEISMAHTELLAKQIELRSIQKRQNGLLLIEEAKKIIEDKIYNLTPQKRSFEVDKKSYQQKRKKLITKKIQKLPLKDNDQDDNNNASETSTTLHATPIAPVITTHIISIPPATLIGSIPPAVLIGSIPPVNDVPIDNNAPVDNTPIVITDDLFSSGVPIEKPKSKLATVFNALSDTFKNNLPFDETFKHQDKINKAKEDHRTRIKKINQERDEEKLREETLAAKKKYKELKKKLSSSGSSISSLIDSPDSPDVPRSRNQSKDKSD